ncbi:MAG: FG-GAP-like repeat-containing protein [Verrucomicrobia subdivision 3 bacterium]|nr:FG-GAP-like repeat-containing protein [Limisphaerales bacterium]
MTLVERFHVNGEPRDAELTDFDGDDWNDVVTIIRDADKVQAYRNLQGALVLSAEAPVGRSPREIAVADFNNDGCGDFVVVNRDSYDVSILLGCGADAVGFQKLDQTYPVDGEVAGLLLVDLNGDQRADVLQLHRASSEISVRLSGTNGQLSLPSFYPTGDQPNGVETADVNGDDKLDAVTANLGQEGTPGTVSVLLGDGLGAFGPHSTVPLPLHTNQPAGRLLAVKAADLDGDGDADLAASFADSRIAFFRGNGDGTFSAAADYSNGFPAFIFAVRQFAAGDFDQDGDNDLAGVSFFGEVGVLENDGDLMTRSVLSPALYTAPELETHMWYRGREIRLEDLNADDDPELVVGLDAGIAIYYGAEDAAFELGQFQSGPGVPVQNTLPAADFSVSGFAFGDFDTDGDSDLAVSCFADGCLSILTRDDGESLFMEAIKVRVPSAEFVASGDIDGDGQADLAGSGRTALWVALSGHRPEIRPSESLQFNRARMTHAVINEVMSSNQKTLLGSAGDRYPDWVELYNPQTGDINLTGWKLEVIKSDGTDSFTFPTGQVLRASDRKLVLCANNPGPDLLATGYRLPDSGATVRLVMPNGSAIDTVRYPPQKADMAYARYADGVFAFHSTVMATPGSPNVYTGPVPPSLKFRGFDTVNFTANVPVRLFAEADDDSAVLGVSLSWRRIDILNHPWQRVLFYDDGKHEDGGAADGLFSGVLEPGLPNGAAIQFYLEATDANNKTTYLPTSPGEAEDSGSSELYVLAFGQGSSPVELTEIVSDNEGVFQDEGMGTPDYVEVANISGETVLLDEYALIDRSLNPDNRFIFPAGTSLEPGRTILVLCDDNPDQGPLHASFKIDNEGDRIYLQKRATAGAYVTVDAIEVPPLSADQSYSRMGARGLWEIAPATPKAPNISDLRSRFRVRTADSTREFILVFPVKTGAPYVVESGPTASGPWTTVATGLGTEVVGTLVFPVQSTDRGRFFRSRSN